MPGVKMEKIKILLVEDELIIMMELKHRLIAMGYIIVATAIAGQEAIDKALKYKPDIILMDIILKGKMDGIEAASIIKETLDIPIIFVTANTDIETIQRAKITDPFGYLVKPIEEKELYTSIEIATFKSELDRKLKNSERNYRTIFNATTEAIVVYDFNTSRIVDVNDQMLNIYGYNKTEALKLSMGDLSANYNDDEQAQISKIIKQVVNCGSQVFEWYAKKKDGSLFWVEISLQKAKIGDEDHLLAVIRDISERKKIEKVLKLTDFAINHVTDLIFWFDRDGFIKYANKKSKELLGINSIPAKIYDLDIDVNYEIIEELWEVLRDNRTINRELMINRKSNITKPFDCKINYINYESEELITVIARDITIRKQAEQKLISAKELAEKSDNLKTEFLAQVSHEIRTPINTLLSFASLLEEDIKQYVSPDLKMCFSSMSNAGKRIIRTIDLILNMAQIQSGTFEIVYNKVDLYEDVLLKMYDEFKYLAEKKGINLVLNRETMEDKIIADEYTISQIFNNLLNNSIKYTDEGEIDITINRDQSSRLFVEIKDTGIGISEEYLPHLTESFSQEEQGYTRRYEGNGLGLALVKKYCELNNAELDVSSIKGVGSTFKILFNPN